jgi:hypothetical protein
MAPQLSSIETVVKGGMAVISGDDSAVVRAIQDAVINARTATFYVSHAQSDRIMQWYFTNERIKRLELEPVSKEEKARIEAQLGVKETGSLYSNRLKCGCGADYGAFEFVQQGIREHGKEMVANVLDLEQTSVIRVNPAIRPICAQCNQRLLGGHYYCWVNGYLCCSSEVLTY